MSAQDLVNQAKSLGSSDAKCLVAEAKYQASAEACITLVTEYIDVDVIGYWESGDLEESQLISSELIKQPLVRNKGIDRRINRLSEQIKFVILKVANEIEEKGYENWQECIEGYQDASPIQKKRVEKLIDAEKSINISLQSLRVTVEMFSRVNQYILDELEKAKAAGNKADEKKLMVTNNILVYELAHFAVNYLDQSGIDGLGTIQEIDQDIKSRINSLQENIRKQQKIADDPNTPEKTREGCRKTAENLINVVAMVQEEWQSYKSQIDTVRAQAMEAKNKSRRILEAKMLQAEGQILGMALVDMIGALQKTTEELGDIANIVDDLELAALTPDRVQRLFLSAGA